MNFLNLKYFLVVASENSVTQAAKQLYISQQSLSNHISLLEKELGVQLFQRSPKFELTYAGTKLVESATKILDLERQIYREMDDIAEQRHGELKIGISHTCGRAILPLILPIFHKQNPLIELTVMEGNSSELEQWLNHGQIDLMISFTPILLNNAKVTALIRERLLLVVPHCMSKSIFDNRYENMRGTHFTETDLLAFSNQPFILLKKGNRVRNIIDNYFRALGFSPNILLETENTETALALAEDGMGIAIYPELFLKYIHAKDDSTLSHVDFFPLCDPATIGTLAICHMTNRYLSRVAEEFIQITKAALSEGFT